MKGIGRLLDKKYGELGFGLFCGAAYFIIILCFLMRGDAKGGLLGFFFFPAIICAAALFVIKLLRSMKEKERFAAINIFMYAHIVLFAAAVAAALELFR